MIEPSGMGLPPFNQIAPADFIFGGEYPEYGKDGKPTGWMRAAWFDPKGAGISDGLADITYLTRPMTHDELAGLPNRASNGCVLA